MKTCSLTTCDRPVKARGLCNMHYMRWQRHGHTDSTRLAGPFEDFYTPGALDECWLWRGSFNAYGYGRYGNPTRMAHRVTYEAANGPIPDGLVIDHLCRNPACVNPGHLEPVLQGTNIERGLHGYPIRTLCKNGLHDITSCDAWYINSRGSRICLECKRANDRRAEAKRGQRVRR